MSRDPDEPQPKRPHVGSERHRGLRLMGAGAHDTEVDEGGDSRVRPLQDVVHHNVAYELYKNLFLPTARALHGMLADFERVNIGLHDCVGHTPQDTMKQVAQRWFMLPDELKATGEYRVNVELALGLAVGTNRSELHDELDEVLNQNPTWQQGVANLLHSGAQLSRNLRAAAAVGPGGGGNGGGAGSTGGPVHGQATAAPVVNPSSGPAAGPSEPQGPVAPAAGRSDPTPGRPTSTYSLSLSQVDASDLVGAFERVGDARPSTPDNEVSQAAGEPARPPFSPAMSYSLPLSQIDASAVFAGAALPGRLVDPSSPAVSSRQPGLATMAPAAAAGASQPVSTMPGPPPTSLRQAGVRQPALGILERAVERGGLSPADVQALIAGGDTSSLVQALRYMVPNLMKPISESEATSASSGPVAPAQRPVQQPVRRPAAGGTAADSAAPGGPAQAAAEHVAAEEIVVPPPPLPPVHQPPIPSFRR